MPRRDDWHPILAAVEEPPGTFRLLDAFGREYGTAELRRVGDGELRYRATFRGELIGWSSTLALAAERIHGAFLRAHGPHGGAVADWGELTSHRGQRVSLPDRLADRPT